MKDKIRTFIAIKIIPEQNLIAQLNEFKRLFKDEQINWVPTDNFHLTLRFIGETTQGQLDLLNDKLEAVARQLRQFGFRIEGTGTFGRKGKPEVLFVKIRFPKEMELLNGLVEKAVTSVGFQKELKPFRPHLTLGRIKKLNNRIRFTNLLAEIDQAEYQEVEVREFVLYRSILRPEGPLYKAIKKYALQ